MYCGCSSGGYGGWGCGMKVLNEDGVLAVMAVVLDVVVIVVADVVLNILLAMVMMWCVCGNDGLAMKTTAVTWW